MENQVKAVPESAQPSKKPRKSIWLFIFLGLACLCICLLIPLVAIVRDPSWLNLLDTGAPRVEISEGSYEGTIYTAPEGNFSCDFSTIMSTSFSPYLQNTSGARSSGLVWGDVWANNDFGSLYQVIYFQLADSNDASLNSEIQNTESDLRDVFNNIILSKRQNDFPGAQVLDQKFVNNKWLVVVHVPHGSNLVSSPASDPSNQTVSDLTEAHYVFVAGPWLYFVVYGITPLSFDTPTTWAPQDTQHMQSQLDEFLAGCDFK